MKMVSLPVSDLDRRQTARLILGGVSPRPIAFVSSLSGSGSRNLAPFSFFNAFGTNPPVVGFSPGRRGGEDALKDTWNNLEKTGECVVQSVPHRLVEQMNLTSTEFGPQVDEFTKSGLTAVPSRTVAPPRVAESPFQMECKVLQLIPLGTGAGAGNLALCEVVCFHVAEYLDWEKGIDPLRLDAVGRMGGSYYIRPTPESVFPVERPAGRECLGFDGLPEWIRDSKMLTGNQLGKLAGVAAPPSPDKIEEILNSTGRPPGPAAEEVLKAYCKFSLSIAGRAGTEPGEKIQRLAGQALDAGDAELAWAILLDGWSSGGG